MDLVVARDSFLILGCNFEPFRTRPRLRNGIDADIGLIRRATKQLTSLLAAVRLVRSVIFIAYVGPLGPLKQTAMMSLLCTLSG